MPYAGTFAAQTSQYRGGHLYLDNQLIPTLADGFIPLNFVEPSQVRSRTHSLLPLLREGSSAKDLAAIRKGDIVVILPLMYSGNTDFKDTPFGMAPAGYSLICLSQ